MLVLNLGICSLLMCFRISGYTEALDDSSDIVVPQDDYGLYAIDILDPSFVSIIFFYIFAKRMYFVSLYGGLTFDRFLYTFTFDKKMFLLYYKNHVL